MSYVDKIKKYGVEYDIHDTRADYNNLVDTVNQAINDGDIQGGNNIISANGILYDNNIGEWKSSITESQFQSLKAADGFYIIGGDEHKSYYIKTDETDNGINYTCLMETSYERINIYLDGADYTVEAHYYNIPNADYFLAKYNPDGRGSLSINRKTGTTIGSYSTAIGYATEATANYTTSIGYQMKVYGANSIGIGQNSTIQSKASNSVNIGNYNDIVENGSYIFGSSNKTLKETGTANSAYIFGSTNTITDGFASCAIGQGNTIIGQYNYVFGSYNKILKYQLASGSYTTPSYAIVLGASNIASHNYAIALGHNLKASKWGQVCLGEYNIEDTSNRGLYKEIFGIGTTEEKRDNGRALDKDGNEYIKGTIYTQCTFPSDGTTLPSIKKEVATKDICVLKGESLSYPSATWATLSSKMQSEKQCRYPFEGPGIYTIELCDNEQNGRVYTTTLIVPINYLDTCFKTFYSTPIIANNTDCLRLYPVIDGGSITSMYLTWASIEFPFEITKIRIIKIATLPQTIL